MSTTAERKRMHKEFMKHTTVLEAHVSEPYVIIRASARVGRRVLIGLGVARYGKDDIFNARVGTLIAHSRAITDLMRQAYELY